MALLIAIGSFLYLFCSCTQFNDGKIHGFKAIDACMKEAELNLIEKPEYALSLMDSIDAYTLHGRERRAYYSLLYTEAQYYCGYSNMSDSLILSAIRFYTVHNDFERLFRSYYLLGYIYSELNRFSEAAVAFSQAEELVDRIDKDFLKGLLYMDMGFVFFNSYDFPRAESYAWKSVDYFERAGKDSYRIGVLNLIASCKIQMNELQEAINILDRCKEWASSVGRTKSLKHYSINRITCMILAKDTISLRTEVDSFLHEFGEPDSNPLDIGMFARYYIMTGDRSMARYYLDKAWDKAAPGDSINLLYTESLLYEFKCELDSALCSYKHCIDIQNNKITKLLEQPLTGAQRDYYRTLSQLESVKARNRVILLILAFLIILFIVAFYSLYSRYKQRQADEKIRNYLFTIDELTAKESLSKETIKDLNDILKDKTASEIIDKETISNLNQRLFELSAWDSINSGKINHLNSKVREMLRQQFIPSDYLFTRFYEQLDDNKKAERLYRVVKNQIDEFTSSSNIGRLDTLLNEAFGGIMDKLMSAGIGLQEKELLQLRFVMAGFSAKSIAAILSDSHQNITQRKKRLLDKIGKKAPDLLLELNTALNIK